MSKGLLKHSCCFSPSRIAMFELQPSQGSCYGLTYLEFPFTEANGVDINTILCNYVRQLHDNGPLTCEMLSV